MKDAGRWMSSVLHKKLVKVQVVWIRAVAGAPKHQPIETVMAEFGIPSMEAKQCVANALVWGQLLQYGREERITKIVVQATIKGRHVGRY